MGTTAQKLTYLNETKTLLKNKINLTGANITNDTFRQYLTKLQNALLECWNNEGEPIFTNWGTKVNGEGTNVKLDNTINARMKITPKGNTTQNGTPTPSSPIPVNVVSGDNEVVVCGKNLFDKDSCTTQVGYFSSNGAVNSGGSSTITTSYTRILPNTQMYLGGGTSTIENVCYYDKDKNFIERTTSNPRSINKNAYYIRFQITTSSLNLNTLQLEVGSTVTTYEPYTSQNYPLYLGVENLFDSSPLYDLSASGVSITHNLDGTFTLNGTYTGSSTVAVNKDMVHTIKTNGTMSIKVLSGSMTGEIRFNLFDSNSSWYNRWVSLTNTNYKDLTDTYTFNKCSIGIFAGASFNNLTIGLQVVEGTKDNSYTPYGTTPIELNKIGTYQDYFYKDSGKWYLHKEVGKVVLDGTNIICTYMFANGTFYAYDTSTSATIKGCVKSSDNVGMKSNYLTSNNYANVFNNGVVGVCTNATLGEIAVNVGISTSKQDINTWLGTHNTYIYFPLETPIETEITNTTLINQLEALKGAMSYEGQTNINGGFMIVGASALGELS